MSELFNFISKLDYTAVIDCKKCIRYKSTRSTCVVCQTVCPQNAIQLIDGEMRVTKECDSCGACAWKCPSQAIAYPKISEDIRLSKIYIDKNIPTEIYTLNYFSYLYMKGVRELLIDSHCNLDQNFYHQFSIFQKLLDNNQLETMKISNFNSEDWEKLSEQIEVSRAELFSRLLKISKNTLEAFLAKKETIEDYFLQLFSNDRKNTLYEVSVDSKCSKCKACVILCPRKCLEVIDNQVVLTGSCNGCNLCNEICPEKAIALKENFID